MNDDLVERWYRESFRLREARNRYLDSLEAIYELADFAAEHVAELDKNRSDGIVIDPGYLKLREHEPDAPTLEGYLNFLGAAAPEDGTSLFEVASKALEEYKASFPEGTDTSALDSLIQEKRTRPRLDLLLASLLIAAVSDFEVLFSSIAGFFFRMRPEALRAQDSKVAWSEIEAYPSLDAVRSHFIEERVNQLMWSGFDDWMKWLENQLKINYRDASLDPVGIIEVFQRRHIIVHNGGLVSAQYLAKIVDASTAGLTIGSPLPVDIKYLDSALDQLTILGVSLIYLIFRKISPQPIQINVDQDILGVITNLVSQERWKAVESVSSTALPHMKHDNERFNVQAYRWFALKRLKGRGAIAQEVGQWDVSALARIFKLAQLTLLDDPAAIDLAEEMIQRREIDRQRIDSWPLLQDFRARINRRLGTSDFDEPAETDQTGPNSDLQ
jgi:hypothetical protein